VGRLRAQSVDCNIKEFAGISALAERNSGYDLESDTMTKKQRLVAALTKIKKIVDSTLRQYLKSKKKQTKDKRKK
jgi:hypothetical protein